MATKTLICLLLLATPSVWSQTDRTVESEDNRSQVPIFLNQHAIKVIAADLNDRHANDDHQVVELATQETVDHNKESDISVTKVAVPEKEDDITSAPSLPVKSNAEQQMPIFLNQHMFNVMGNELAGKNNDKSPEEDLDVTTEISVEVPEKSEVASHHHVPMFPDQNMIQGIMNLQNIEHKVQANTENEGNVDNGQSGSVNDATTEMPIAIPEPKEHYKNSLYLYGHHHDTTIHLHVMILVSSAMTQELSYGAEHLITYPLSTSYEWTSTGLEVTKIEYVVTYNGRVLAEYEVTHTLSRPVPSRYLHNGLYTSHLTQHFAAEGPLPTQATATKKNTFIVPVIAIVSTLAVLAILLTVISVIYVKRTRVSPPKSKDKKELMKYILKADKTRPTPVEPIKPPPYSENPAYEV